VVRGGLQAVPQEQYEIADALGLKAHQKYLYIVLPQALRLAVPPLVNTLVGLFKDTSLVAIIGVFDLLQAVKVSLGEPRWTGFGVEAYLFAALVYFLFCFAMSAYSKRLELSPMRSRPGGPRAAA
jgi:general L-amino acid transport system permease protein